MPPRIVKLIAPSLYQEKVCDTFSVESSVDQQAYYSARGESDVKKLKAWAYNGKLAEFAVFNTLLSYKHYKKVSPPDVMIYETARKSHDADITADGKNVHVKSCMVVEGWESSWLFSIKDRLVTSPSDDDIVCLVKVYVNQKFEAYFIPAKKLVGLYREPYHKKTVAHALYESDLPE